MITGSLEPITSGKTWTETLYLTDENGVPLAESLLNELTFTVAVKELEGSGQYLSTSAVTILDDGTISWSLTGTGSLCQNHYRVTVDVTDAGPDATERIAEFILPVMRD